MKRTKKGFALVSAVVIAAVLSILTAGLITAAMMSMNLTAKNIDQRQAYLNAKSALGFAESYYIDQLMLPDNDEYLSFSSENGAVSSGADRSNVVKNTENIETPPDAETYVKAQYDMAAQTFKLTATARFRSAALDGVQTLQLSCTYEVGYDADGRITTVVRKIDTKDQSRYVYIHVKPYDDEFQPYLYTWGYGTGQEEQKPDDGKPDTLFSGEWLSSQKTDGQGNLLYEGPQGAMLRETGGTGGWNGWYYMKIELRDENVKYINAIIAKKGALRDSGDNTTQSHEIFHLPVPENAGETQDVYITLNSEKLHDFRGTDMDDQGELPDSFTEYLTSYVKADYTTVHIRVAGAKDKERKLSAPKLIMAGAIADKNLSTVTTEAVVQYTGGTMLYEGYGWYRINVPSNEAFAFSIEDEGNTVFRSDGAIQGGIDNQIWIALPASDMGGISPYVLNSEEEAKKAFLEMNPEDTCEYSTVYVKGLALSREDINDVPTVLMNYFAKDDADDGISLPDPSGKYLLTLEYNDENDTINKKLCQADQKVVLPTLTRAGYTFRGWAASSTKPQPDYLPGDTYTVRGSAYLYGVWEIIEYLVQYDANGGQNPPPTQSFTVEAPVKFASQGDMKNESCAFLGWAKTPQGGAQYKAGDTIDPSVLDGKTSITLYAVWKDSFSVMYDVNGGDGTAPAKQSVRPGKSVILSGGSGLSRKGYRLLGWSEDKNAQSTQYRFYQTIVPERDLTLYAVWEKTSVTVYFSNARGFADVYAYVWKDGTNADLKDWPGEKMTDTGKTAEGYKIYSCEVPLDGGYDRIIFNPGGDSGKTSDLILTENRPFYYYKYGFGVNGDVVSTTGLKTVYFTDNRNWGRVSFYAWNDAQGTKNLDWPGKSMEFAEINDYGQKVYRYRYPVGKYKYAVFSSGSDAAKTVDIDISQDENNQGYFINSSSSPYAVEKYVYSGLGASASYFSLRASALTKSGAFVAGASLQNRKAAVLQGLGTTLSSGNPFGGQSLLSAAGGWLKSWLAPATLPDMLSVSVQPLRLPALNEINGEQTNGTNPDNVYLTGTFNSWAYDNADYKMETADGSCEKFNFTMTLPGGSSYKFNLCDDKTTVGKMGADFNGETAESNALEADGDEMGLRTTGTNSDRIDVTFDYGRKTVDGKTAYTLKVTQKPSATKESFHIYIGVSSSIVSSKGTGWKTPDVECKDAGGTVSGYTKSAALSADTARIAYNGGEEDFFLSYAQIPTVRNRIRLSVNTVALKTDFLQNAKEDHLYLLYQTDGKYYIADNGEYTPSMDGIINFDGVWTQENIEIASDRGTKVQYYNTLMRKYKNAADKIVPVEPFKATYGDERFRAGNSATCYLNDWYTYKIPTQGSYTLQFTGLNGKENTFESAKDDQGTEAGRAKLGCSTAVINSLSGDTWITLNTIEKTGDKLSDLSVYTYDPEDNYAGKETTVYLDDKALWGGESHDQPVYVYYWGVKTMAWPGKEMKYDEKTGMYYTTVPSGSPFLVFNNAADTDSPECQKSDILTLQADGTKVRFNNAAGEWESYIHPKNALYKAISDATAALNRSTIQKNRNKEDGMVSFTVLETLITDARAVYDNDSFNEFDTYTKLLNAYVAEIGKFNDILRETRIYLDGYPEHQNYDGGLTYSRASLANLLDAHTEAMKVFGITDRSSSLLQIRSQASKLRRAIDSLELRLSGGSGMQPGQAVVVLDNQAQWPVLTASGGPGCINYTTYKQNEDREITGEVQKQDYLTQYNSQGYYLYFIEIPSDSNTASAKFLSCDGQKSTRKTGIKAGEVWVYNNQTGKWRENTAGDFQVIGVSTISGKRGDERVYSPKQAGEDFRLYVTYDTTVKYDGAQYVIYANVYDIKYEEFPDGINLFSREAKAFFTDPQNFGFDPSDNPYVSPVSSSTDCGWTDANGGLMESGGTGAPVSGTVNFLIGGRLGADSPDTSGETPEKAPGSGITGGDLDASGQHNLITGNSTPFENGRSYSYRADKINFRWVEGDVLDVTGVNFWLNSENTTFACAELSVEKTYGTNSGSFLVGRNGAGFEGQTITFYNDVTVTVYNSDATVSKDDSFTIRNGRYKIDGQIDLFKFKELLNSGKVVSVDSSSFSGGVYRHD